MIENCSGSVESSLSLTVVAKTRQKLSRQRARKRKRRVTSVETNEDFAKFITKWIGGQDAGVVNFDHLPWLFLNCIVNRERFGMFEEVTKTLQMFNSSTIFDDELKRLRSRVNHYARGQMRRMNKATTIKCFERLNNDYDQKTRLDLKMRHALAVQYEAWPLNRDGLVNFTMVLNAVKGLKQHILGEEVDHLYDEAAVPAIQTKMLTCGEFVDYLSSICYNVIRKPGLWCRPSKSSNLDQSIRLLNEYAKTACRFINFEIWRVDFYQLFERICDSEKRLDRTRFIECLSRFYHEKCRIPERARLVLPPMNTRPKSPQKKQKPEQVSPRAMTEVAPSLDNNGVTISPKKNSGSLVAPMEKVLRPVLEDREKTFDSSVSVEFKVEGIC